MVYLIHFKTSPVQPLKFGNRQVMSSNALLGMSLLIHDWPILVKEAPVVYLMNYILYRFAHLTIMLICDQIWIQDEKNIIERT